MDAFSHEIMRQKAAGNIVVHRDMRVSVWLVAAVKSVDGKWMGQINQKGDFIPNCTHGGKE